MPTSYELVGMVTGCIMVNASSHMFCGCYCNVISTRLNAKAVSLTEATFQAPEDTALLVVVHTWRRSRNQSDICIGGRHPVKKLVSQDLLQDMPSKERPLPLTFIQI